MDRWKQEIETAATSYPHKCVLPHFKHLYECKGLNALTALNALNASLQPCRAPSDRMRACRAPKPTYTDTPRNRAGKQATQTHKETEQESTQKQRRKAAEESNKCAQS
mmetsp:Transcript_60691/g.88942  ORF Transcript_60691/g.88942 Transcript_60691/m.88942 type:complete len:108 (+) Transcript_60691:291-614(+)